MKNIVNYLVYGCLLSMCLLACDFLDEKPYSELTNENLEVGFGKDSVKYTTAVQAEQLINGAYSDFASEFWQLDLYIMNDAQADNAYAGESKDQTVQIDQLRLISTNGNVSRDWNYIYTHISKANTILTYVPAIADPALTETRKNEILGEAAFMRAICYFNLVRIYGSVPMILQAIPEISMENLEEVYPLLYPAQSSVEDIYAQIVKDLEYAQANVADYSAFKFKITKAFANLLLAEVYATKDGVEKTDWTSVKKYAEKVVNDGRYGLLPHYNDVFAVANPLEKGILPYLDLLNENSKESIFEVDYNSWTTLGNWAGQMFVGIDWKKFNTPSHDLYDAFTREGDLVRRDASILLYDVSGKWTDTYWPSSAYPYSWKIRAQEKNNIVLYRLPEAILLLADAENELGNTAKAAQLVNQIRTRAGLPNTTAAIKEDMRLAIENEHRFEFAFEGKRWMDLKRRGRFIQAMRACTDHQREYGLAMKETQLLWPIPQSELDLNRNLKQNPGY